ncbi:hypothetical protein JRQ81_016113, partial [Phrynocephalus forsythii]
MARYSAGCPPTIVVIYLGGNDLTQVLGKTLILQVIDDLNKFYLRFLGTRILWSVLIPCLECRSVNDPKKVHKARK